MSVITNGRRQIRRSYRLGSVDVGNHSVNENNGVGVLRTASLSSASEVNLCLYMVVQESVNLFMFLYI